MTAKKPAQLEKFLRMLGFRVQILGSPQWDGKRWVMWLVPPDDVRLNMKSVELKENF